ncbi:hypothetical protein MNBD_PLANCTO02-2100 [hydrothermal vent metagenome]|uniref:Uncharacterized protein n=1 Tax=hydrothermal vent metagenome TaxID=652676 RepID=A0A3B1D618_9ZZZZ
MRYQSIYRYTILFALLFSLAVTSGCKEKPKITGAGSPATTPSKRKIRTSLKGKWRFFIVQHQLGGNNGQAISTEISVALLEFKPKDPSDKETDFKTTLLDTTNLTGKRTLVSAEVKGDNVHIVLGGDEEFSSMDFQGSFSDGVVRGSVLLKKQGNQCITGLLLPVPDIAEKFASDQKPRILFKKEEQVLAPQLQRAGNNPQLYYQTFNKYAKQNPQRAFSLFLYEYRTLPLAIRMRLPEEKFEELYKSYMKSAAYWGPRYQKFARVKMASILARSGYLPEVAMRHFDELGKEFSEEEKKLWQKQVTFMRNLAKEQKERIEEAIRIGDLVKKLQAKDKKTEKEGEKEINKVLAQKPYQIPLIQVMADYYEKQGKIDKAIMLTTKLAVLPSANRSLLNYWKIQKIEHDFPRTVLTRLWKKKYGNTDKLEEHLTKTYEKILATIPGEKFTRSGQEAGNHVVLCELFTGSKCPPCVAADIATGALEATFSPSDLIVLRYHQHIPGADPLTNQDGQYRFGYYRGSGTPMIVIDGEKSSVEGGYNIKHAKERYQSLVKIVKEKLPAKTDIKIALTATGKGKTLHVSAKVTGLKKPPATLRLRLVLAEERIPFVAANGIRIHEMVVRKMPGGIGGTEFENGTMEYSEEISLAEFKTDLIEQLEAIEEENKEQENLFPIVPMSLQKLHLIGIVQDDKDRTVLQSVIIPVTGELIYPETKVAPETVPTKEEKPQPEKTPPQKITPQQEKSKEKKPDAKKKEEKPKEKKGSEKSAFIPLPSELQNVLFVEPEEKEKSKEGDNADKKEKPKEKKEKVIHRKTIEGNWVLEIYHQEGTGFPIVLLQVEKSPQQKYELKPIDFVEQIGKLELKKKRLEKTSVMFVVDGNLGKLRFDGRLLHNTIVGTAQFEGGTVIPAILHPFDQKKLGERAEKTREDENVKLLSKKLEAAKKIKEVFQFCNQFIKKHPHSPFTMEVYSDILLTNAKRAKLSTKEVNQIANGYIKQAAYWGEKMEQYARIHIASSLIDQKFAPQVAKHHLDEAAKNVKPQSFFDWDLIIKPSLLKLELVTALLDIRSENKETQKKGFDFLVKYQKKEPFNYRTIWALAQYAQQKKNNKEAIRLYAQLTSLPLMQQMLRREWAQENLEVQPTLPSDELVKLWKKEHGSIDALDQYLDTVYQKALETIPGEKYQGRNSNAKNHVVLCELFTGSKCPPCVGADLATSALQKTFAPTEMVMLRYHQHIPGPDPFANTQNAERLSYYNGKGTPSIYIDGKPFPPAGGYLQNAKETYNLLRPLIEKRLGNQSEMAIALTTKVVNGQLKLTANVTGLPKENKPLRLRLVLAEESVNYVAGNGVRLHEMIVRKMPGGVDGIKVKEGKLQYDGSLSLANFKKGLLDDLENFEKESGYPLPVKPLALEKLSFIAFVQNDNTLEVLQSAMVSIKEKLKYPQPLPENKKEKENK